MKIEQLTFLEKYGAPIAPGEPPQPWQVAARQATFIRESTSQAAARRIRPAAPKLRQRVYEWIRSRGPLGATRDEIERDLAMSGNTVRPRVRELIAEGRVYETDMHRTTSSGRAAMVLRAWEVADNDG